MSFIVGDRVGYVSGKLRYDENGDNEPGYGAITDVLSNDRYLVKWDHKYMNDTLGGPIGVKCLQPEADLHASWGALEEAFKTVENEVRAKMKEASALILDAKRVAKEAGIDLIMNMWDATSSLEGAMSKAGWNTSSWHC